MEGKYGRQVLAFWIFVGSAMGLPVSAFILQQYGNYFHFLLTLCRKKAS